MICCAQEEHRTDSHSYENRCHVLRAFTDGECEILDTLLCVKRWFNTQEETSVTIYCHANHDFPIYNIMYFTYRLYQK